MRVVEQAARAEGRVGNAVAGRINGQRRARSISSERFLSSRSFIAEGTGNEAGNGVHDEHGCEFTTAKHEVTHGYLAIGKKLAYALVHPLVPPADQDQAIQTRKLCRNRLREYLALRGQQDNRLLCSTGDTVSVRRDAQRLDTFKNRLGLQ